MTKRRERQEARYNEHLRQKRRAAFLRHDLGLSRFMRMDASKSIPKREAGY
jgi:hypothetical protein